MYASTFPVFQPNPAKNDTIKTLYIISYKTSIHENFK